MKRQITILMIVAIVKNTQIDHTSSVSDSVTDLENVIITRNAKNTTDTLAFTYNSEGRELSITYLTSIFLSIGVTRVILPMPGNVDEVRLLLKVIANAIYRKLGNNLQNFVSILSVLDAYY